MIGRYSTVFRKRGAHMACDWTLCNNRPLIMAPPHSSIIWHPAERSRGCYLKYLKMVLARFGGLACWYFSGCQSSLHGGGGGLFIRSGSESTYHDRPGGRCSHMNLSFIRTGTLCIGSAPSARAGAVSARVCLPASGHLIYCYTVSTKKRHYNLGCLGPTAR